MTNHIDDSVWQTAAAVNEANEFIHFQLFHSILERMKDTIALVPLSHGTIYKRKSGFQVDTRQSMKNWQFITVKYVNDPPKWVNDDRTD